MKYQDDVFFAALLVKEQRIDRRGGLGFGAVVYIFPEGSGLGIG